MMVRRLRRGAFGTLAGFVAFVMVFGTFATSTPQVAAFEGLPVRSAVVASVASLDVLCPPHTLSASDPRVQWAEGTGADDDGATRDYLNRGARLAWDNFMGDWRDRVGAAQGAVAYATLTLPDDDTPGAHSWDVTSLVVEWLAGTPNQGFYLQQVAGSGPFDFYSREHSVSGERPSLNVVTDAGSFALAPVADTHLRSSSYGSVGDSSTFRISGDRNRVLIRFDLSVIPVGATVTSSTLGLFSFAEFGSSSMQVGVFRVFNDPGVMPPVVSGGLASGFEGDVGIGAHPDVHVFTDFESADWSAPYSNRGGSTLQRVSSGPGFEPIDGAALRVTVPAGGNTGMSVTYLFADQIGREPTEVFFRYYLRFDESWQPTTGGKLPGIAGTYDRAGWGGRKSDGTNGWSSRGSYYTSIPHGNPLGNLVPVGNYVYHTGMGQWGDGVLWQDGLLGFLEKERWYSVEQRLVMNTPGFSDGITETWIDGRLAYRQTNWQWRNTGADHLKIDRVWLNVFHGGRATPDTDIHLYIDNIVISSSYIGPMTGAPCAPGGGAPPVAPGGGTFTDDDGSFFEQYIERIFAAGITRGCSTGPEARFCPDDGVTRGEMAAFLVRALGLTDRGTVTFADDDGLIFEPDIEKLAAAGITLGCTSGPDPKFCPDDVVTRGQMAAFLTRALGL